MQYRMSIGIPGGFGEEEQSEKQDDSRNHLQAPRDAERRWAICEAAPIGDIEHDQNTPGDGPLLCTNDTASLARRRQLGDVHGNYASG